MAAKIKKGSLVKANPEKLANSLEATASDTRFPSYLFESKGEILELNGDYALVKFYVATPNIWLNVELLEPAD
ncbi:MAG: NAD(P)H-quinone oxidoreductase subunit O [Xenococcaceae cyanobacterium MO_207.B15]|nr:NAD(P)H-quinone oxidoreductase subunit O [Xenococcaceae cyanobacterium MO_207.B15]MDJ0742687.1 NAD(P)H-quinone oxidoreductase subunit O [Xenococcaceae cyanobacterium MO_167.B27]